MVSHFIKFSYVNETSDQIRQSVRELSVLENEDDSKLLYHSKYRAFVSHGRVNHIDWSLSNLDEIIFFIDPKKGVCDYNHNRERFVANIKKLGDGLQVTVFSCCNKGGSSATH